MYGHYLSTLKKRILGILTAEVYDGYVVTDVEEVGGIYVVTADHGNAEDMVKRNKKGEPLLDKDGNVQIQSSHTLRPVSQAKPPYDGWLLVKAT